MDVVLDNLGTFGDGFLGTLKLTLIAGVLSLLLGTVLAAMRVSPTAVLRGAGTAYVEVLRNTPLTIVFFFAVFVLPQLDVRLSFSSAAVVALTVYHAAFFCEAVRSGINSVGVGQAEAARSIGLTFRQTMRHVVLPQAFRTVVPPLINVFIALTKNTSIASAFAVFELIGVLTRLATADRPADPDHPRGGGLLPRHHRPGRHRRRGAREARGGGPVTSVLYDAPGPRARRRAQVQGLVGGLVLLALVLLVLQRLSDKGQLDGERWSVLKDPDVQRALLTGLEGTLKAAGVAALLSVVLGVLLALGRLSRWPVLSRVTRVWVELFRGLPLLLLIFLLTWAARPSASTITRSGRWSSG